MLRTSKKTKSFLNYNILQYIQLYDINEWQSQFGRLFNSTTKTLRKSKTFIRIHQNAKLQTIKCE
jgi:hypothetical protein